MADGFVVYLFRVEPLVAIGLRTLLMEVPGCTFAPEESDWSSFFATLEATCRSTEVLVILDYNEAEQAAHQALATLAKQEDNVHLLLFLPSSSDETLIAKVLRGGGDGYIFHSATADVVLRAITAVREGKSFLEPVVTSFILSELRKPVHSVLDSDVTVELTERERLFLQLSADGMSNVQIAEVLGLREKTIRNLWSTLFEKLGMNDRTQAVMWAIRTGQAELR